MQTISTANSGWRNVILITNQPLLTPLRYFKSAVSSSSDTNTMKPLTLAADQQKDTSLRLN